MKTGRPNYYLPSQSTVGRDVRNIFLNARERLAIYLQVGQPLLILYHTESTHQDLPGALGLATDCWTSPNHQAFLAVTVQFLDGRITKSIILDVVELPKSHTGVNMATVIAKIIHEFGIEKKVSRYTRR
jgi:hypothetical protein